MNPAATITVSAAEWTNLVSRVSALEAQQEATVSTFSSLREDFRRMESRLYALVALGTTAGSAGSAVAAHFIGS